MARKITNQLIDLINEGYLDPLTVAMAALNYMSEAQVADMAHSEELIDEEEEPVEDEEDDDSGFSNSGGRD
jgi:ribosomal protein L12E/L44/L45/RPP1/RPP2